ncbi:MAG: CotH kinase family protein [Crocinitomicaceae bacterium]|nr:CotH kinase family protein [Crocinitomicaceae bacterium]
MPNSVALHSLLALIVSFSSYSFAQQPAIVINEILASNDEAYSDGFGEFDDWIELYNSTDERIDLGGMFLTDDLDDPTRYRIPEREDKWTTIAPKGYALYWADGDPEQGDRHMDFRLKKKKGIVALFDHDTILVDMIKYQMQETDISFGRAKVNSPRLANFYTPTPSKPNVDGRFEVPDSLRVIFDTPAGMYASSLEVSLSNSWDAPIYYTTNGSTPRTDDSLYSGPIQIDSNTVLRASVIKKGYQASIIGTQTYLIGEESTLSILSLSTSPENLWNKRKGIYKNYEKRGWTRSAHVEYFDLTESGEFIPAVNKTVDIRIAGKTSRRQPKKSFNVIANQKDGDKKIRYKFFDSKDINEFKGISVRADATSGRNVTDLWVGERFKNELIYEINDQMNGNVSMQAYEPVLLFLNGEYWGIYNMMERKGKDFIEQNHGVEDMDILTYQDPKPVRGSAEDYDDLITFIQMNDISFDSVYQVVCDQVDIESYIDQWVYETYSGAHDIGVNIRCWKSTEPGSKWKWISYDQDSWNTVHENSFAYFLESEQIPLYGRLMLNKKFRNQFLNRLMDYLNTKLNTENVLTTLDKILVRIENEVDRERARWEDTMLYIPKGQRITWMKDYAARRPEILRKQMVEYFNLVGGSTDITVIAPVGGKIRVNSLTHDSNWMGTYLENLPIQVEAIPDEGYVFVKWKGRKFPKSNMGRVLPVKAKKIRAVFKHIKK